MQFYSDVVTDTHTDTQTHTCICTQTLTVLWWHHRCIIHNHHIYTCSYL